MRTQQSLQFRLGIHETKQGTEQIGMRQTRFPPRVMGILLAAGAGVRYGKPKALVADWLMHAVVALRTGGCDRVIVVLGAEADKVTHLVPDGADIVRAPNWREGMGASLRAGLVAAEATEADAALVHLVDLPDVGSRVVRRILATAERTTLARATYGGSQGHPVLLGRDHWHGVCVGASGDQGARAYLQDHRVKNVECGDLASGCDVDVRAR